MEGANRSLSEFVGFLNSPDMYGSMTVAAQMLSWLVTGVVAILMLAAIIGVCFIVFKFACDVVFISGLGQMAGKFGDKLKGFASPSALEGDIGGYLKKDLWKLLVTLAFVGILASGMALPLAGQVAGIIGAGVEKLVGSDPASKIKDFTLSKYGDAVKLMSAEEKKTQYDQAVAEMKTYRDQLNKLGSSGNISLSAVEIDEKKTLYTIAYGKANKIQTGLGTELKEEAYYKQHTKAPLCVKELARPGNTGITVTCSQ